MKIVFERRIRINESSQWSDFKNLRSGDKFRIDDNEDELFVCKTNPYYDLDGRYCVEVQTLYKVK